MKNYRNELETAFFVAFGVMIGWLVWRPSQMDMDANYLLASMKMAALVYMEALLPLLLLKLWKDRAVSGIIKAYTLMEVLIVCGIMLLLMAIAMPSFVKIMKGNAVKSGIMSLTGNYKLARSYAITTRTYVAMVMPDDSIANNYKLHNSKRLFTTFRMAEVQVSGASCTFIRWLPNVTWMDMPTGSYIASVSNATPVKEVDLNDIGEPGDDPDPLKHGFALSMARCLVICPSGVLFEPIIGNPVLIVKEGIYTNGSLTNTNAANQTNMTINQFTGSTFFP
jgi:type II secretory pathway pseudopilin PulG